jgi:hypothetical protein
MFKPSLQIIPVNQQKLRRPKTADSSVNQGLAGLNAARRTAKRYAQEVPSIDCLFR